MQVIVPLDEGKLYIIMYLLVFEGLCIIDTVTGILNLLFLICNDSDSLSVIGPTGVTVSSLGTLPIVGPNRGDLQHGDGAALHNILVSKPRGSQFP